MVKADGMEKDMKIGFIGLGNMGAPMVRRLVAAGHKVTGYDVMESAMAALSEVKMNSVFSNFPLSFNASKIIPTCTSNSLIISP